MKVKIHLVVQHMTDDDDPEFTVWTISEFGALPRPGDEIIVSGMEDAERAEVIQLFWESHPEKAAHEVLIVAQVCYRGDKKATLLALDLKEGGWTV